MIKRAAILILLLSAYACEARKPTPPPGLISPADFADLYVDLLKLGVQVPSNGADTLSARRGVDSLLQAHNATRDAVRASVAWYNQDVARWRPIMDSVTARLAQ
jgi:hypothetical protein